MKIEDLLACTIDNRGKTPPVSSEGHCLLEINCIASKKKYPDYSLIRKYVSEDVYNTWFRSGHPQKGDILIPTVGTLDAVGICDRDDCCIAQNLIAFRVDSSVCEREYFYYLLCDPVIRKRVLQLDIGGVQPSIKVPHLKKLEIDIPNIEKQKRIAEVLARLDSKIQNNTIINKNLEEQAQALYNELFADSSFDATLADLGTIVGGSTPSKKHPEYYTDQGIAWITPKDLSNNSSKFIYHGENDITELGLSKCSASVMPSGTVLFSSRAPIGYIAVAANPTATNQGFKSVIPNDEIGTAFVYYFLKNNLTMIESMASGSTFKEISANVMKAIPAFKPDGDKLYQFRKFCEPLFYHQQMLESENTRLAQLRDTLLPRLMSGEVDVSKIDI